VLSPIVCGWTDAIKNIINVKDFGAVGDGVAIDIAAIQAAFENCSSWVGEKNR